MPPSSVAKHVVNNLHTISSVLVTFVVMKRLPVWREISLLNLGWIRELLFCDLLLGGWMESSFCYRRNDFVLTDRIIMNNTDY